MGMDVAIAKRRLGGQHVVLRICRGSELTGDFDDVSIDGLNGLLLSKNFLQLMEAIESLGPISAEKLNSPAAKAALADDEWERVVPAGEIRELFRSGELSEPDAERLGEEAYLEYLGNGTVNKRAMDHFVERLSCRQFPIHSPCNELRGGEGEEAKLSERLLQRGG